MTLHIAWLVYLFFLLAAGVLLCVPGARGIGDSEPTALARAALAAGKGLWVLLTCASCTFAVVTLQPEFVEFFWLGQARLQGSIASALALLIIVIGQTVARKKRSRFRFLILPILLFIAAMPVVARIVGDALRHAEF